MNTEHQHQVLFDTAVEQDSAELYRKVIALPETDEETQRFQESAVMKLCTLLSNARQTQELASLVRELRPFFNIVPKAKTAKLVRNVIDALGKIPGSVDAQVKLCSETIEWCKAEKRSFLRVRLELKLAALLLEQGKYASSLGIVNSVLREVKRLDDKALLVEIHLTESKVYHALNNVPKSRAALTAARTAANSIYIGPELQMDIDLQAGTLHAEEKDFKTAYSYFYEAFEGANGQGDTLHAMAPLKYMLLCKVMSGAVEDVSSIIGGKAGIKYAGRGLEAMRALASAYKMRSLHEFERALTEYKDQIGDDALMSRHLQTLGDMLLEQNLTRLIEPFSCVEIAHVAELIGLPLGRVEAKLGQLILDKKVAGTLDQGKGQLLLFDKPHTDKAYDAALKTIASLGEVVDILQRKAEKLQ